jgi:cell division protein FtsL
MTTRQTLHREADPRSRRTMASALALSALLVASTLGLVALRVQQVRLSYQLDSLRAARQGLEELDRQLRVEAATLRSPARIEARARALGLTAPAREQVRLAREFVVGGAGTASLQLAQSRSLVTGVGVR